MGSTVAARAALISLLLFGYFAYLQFAHSLAQHEVTGIANLYAVASDQTTGH